MKKHLFCILLGACGYLITSCGSMSGLGTDSNTTTAASGSSSLEDILGAITGSLLGNSAAVKKADLIGAWKYAKPDCRFESADLLKKAGGELVAGQVESKLAETFMQVGISANAASMSFAENGTAQFVFGGRSFPLAYSLNENTRIMTLTDPILGLISMDATVCKSSNNRISILFDSQKLLSLISMAGGYTNNANLQAISKLLGSYDGMKVGLELNK